MPRKRPIVPTHVILLPENRPQRLASTVAGPLLDALVAVDVMLETVSLENPSDPRYRTHAGTPGNRVPKFSSKPAAARLVRSRLEATLCAVDTEHLPDGKWRCTVTPPRTFETGPVTVEAATEPLALCLAARLVLRPHVTYPCVYGVDDALPDAA